MLGGPNVSRAPLLLKDEGVVLGYVTSLDFRGLTVLASRIGLAGIVTVGQAIVAGLNIGVVPATEVGSTTLVLPVAPDAGPALYRNRQRLRKVASSPGANEFAGSGTTYTLDRAVQAADRFWCNLQFGALTSAPDIGVAAVGSGVAWSFATAPLTDSDEVFVSGFAARRVVSSPGVGEYLMTSADDFTLGWDPGAGFVWTNGLVAGLPPSAWHPNDELPQVAADTVEFPYTPIASSESLFLGTRALRRVVGAPGIGEYRMTTAVRAQLWRTIGSDVVVADGFEA